MCLQTANARAGANRLRSPETIRKRSHRYCRISINIDAPSAGGQGSKVVLRRSAARRPVKAHQNWSRSSAIPSRTPDFPSEKSSKSARSERSDRRVTQPSIPIRNMTDPGFRIRIIIQSRTRVMTIRIEPEPPDSPIYRIDGFPLIDSDRSSIRSCHTPPISATLMTRTAGTTGRSPLFQDTKFRLKPF